MGGQRGVEVQPVIDLGARHHQGMPGPQRMNGRERHALVIAPDEATGQLAIDDPGENGGHGRPPPQGRMFRDRVTLVYDLNLGGASAVSHSATPPNRSVASCYTTSGRWYWFN